MAPLVSDASIHAEDGAAASPASSSDDAALSRGFSLLIGLGVAPWLAITLLEADASGALLLLLLEGTLVASLAIVRERQTQFSQGARRLIWPIGLAFFLTTIVRFAVIPLVQSGADPAASANGDGAIEQSVQTPRPSELEDNTLQEELSIELSEEGFIATQAALQQIRWVERLHYGLSGLLSLSLLLALVGRPARSSPGPSGV